MSRAHNPSRPLFDASAVLAAEQTVNQAIAGLLGGRSRSRGVVVTAPAGAGKSYLVSTAVDRARDRGLRVAVGAPTNAQAFGLVGMIARRHCSRGGGRTVTFVPGKDVSLPDAVHTLPGVRERKADEANEDGLIVANLSKLGDAFCRGSLEPFDALLIDEAYQADAAKYFAAGGLAPLHLLVGDGGQISPFATIEDPCRWRGLPEDPLQTAVGVLRRNHPTTPVYGMPITRRLDGRAARVAQLFYPDLSFAPAVLPGVRQLRLRPAPATDPRARTLDAALALAVREGWAHVELPRAAVLSADSEAIGLLVDLVRRLFEQTANKLQGLEFEVVFVWHPLAGLPEVDAFHLDPGRLCVLLTRHRQACVVVGRASDRELLEDQVPPPTAAYLGHDADPVLDGWEVHRQVFAALDPFCIRT